MPQSHLETTATENPSYDLAAEWVAGRIAAETDRGAVADDSECVTIPKMEDCDCIPLDVQVDGSRWSLAGVRVRVLSVEATYRRGGRGAI